MLGPAGRVPAEEEEQRAVEGGGGGGVRGVAL